MIQHRLSFPLVVLYVLTSILLFNSSGEAADDSVWAAVGRLKVEGGWCTAFVARSFPVTVQGRFGEGYTIYENWIVTAGHCAINTQYISFLPSTAGRQNYFWDESLIGMSVGYDVALIKAWSFKLSPSLALSFGEEPTVGDSLMMVGYGRKSLMARVGRLVGYGELGEMVIDNYAQPGNSGAPVLIPGTNRVVGIGVGSTVNYPPGVNTPYPYCYVATCSRKPPYFAARVDWLRGLARWP